MGGYKNNRGIDRTEDVKNQRRNTNNVIGRGIPLMTDKCFDDHMAGPGRGLVFNNYFQNIGDNAEYRGQW